MNLLPFVETPFQINLCFEPVFENLEKLAADPTNDGSVRAQVLLQELAPYPELRYGITDVSQITQNVKLINRLLVDYFPPALTLNEIKAVNIPYTSILFNHTERFKKILNAAGTNFEINIRDFDEHQFYVLSCCLILNEVYGTQLDFSKPLFYDIPGADGIIKHYRILHNGDFMDVFPTEKSVPLSQDDIDQLLDNYDDIALWKEKFPQESWQMKGFTVMTLFDATIENAVSIFKEKLLGINTSDFQQSVESIFRSIFRIPDIKVGFTFLNQEEGVFSTDPFGQQIRSFILQGDNNIDSRKLLCLESYHKLLEEKTYFSVSDTVEYHAVNPESPLASHFLEQGFRSFVLAPVVKNELLFGLLEIVSFRSKELNSINANKLEVVMPFLTDTIERLAAELQNQVQAVIQNAYTTIHESVYWKFRAEAQKLISNRQIGKTYELKEIVFADVYPLYGQIDIKGSSDARNLSVQKDLEKQVQALLSLFKELRTIIPEESFMKEEHQLNDYLTDLSLPLRASTEQYINTYLSSRIHNRLKQLSHPEALPFISQYFRETNKEHGDFHIYRRKYETTITLINRTLTEKIDYRQTEAQTLFPHYYERFKTDGIEHNLYIGSSIAPTHKFEVNRLYALRLWQLHILCEMETAHSHIRPELPYPLDVTTLILVYNSTISIRFRMDEKRFDVDGSYNARFEIVKKRIDKACIKNTTERITQPGKIAIVYSNYVEEQEYLQYIKVLQARELLDNEIEKYEVEDLQGISGLKVLRVKIVHPKDFS